MNSKFHEIFHSVIIGAVSDGAGFRYAGHFVVLLGERWRRWWWWWFLLLLLGMLVLQLLLLGEEGAKGSTIFPLAQAPWAGLPSQAPQPRPLAPWPRPPSLGPTGPSLVKAGRMDGWTDRRTGQDIPPVFYRAVAPKGTKSCRTQGEFLSVLPSVCPSIRPALTRLGLWGLGWGAWARGPGPGAWAGGPGMGALGQGAWAKGSGPRGLGWEG